VIGVVPDFVFLSVPPSGCCPLILKCTTLRTVLVYPRARPQFCAAFFIREVGFALVVHLRN
jgi:hypothetical protein